MPSNETLELIESVLTSVSESERAYYRIYDIYQKKINDLDNQIKNEEKKVEYYGKNPDKLNKLIVERNNLESKSKQYDFDPERISERKGNRNPNVSGDYFRKKASGISSYLGSTDPLRPGVKNRKLSDNEEALHKRIDKRTKAFDTTAKHEAACILIEALNTLLNE